MENTILSIVLFIIYFSIVSWLQYRSIDDGVNATKSKQISIEQQIKDMFAALDNPIPSLDLNKLNR
jgi:hypothetical protein